MALKQLNTQYHIPVLLNETIDALNIDPTGVYVDGTLGGGGHSFEIYQKLTTGKLISIDRDIDSINFVETNYDFDPEKWIIRYGNFSKIAQILENLAIKEVSGVLVDLGVSSHQLDIADRGFSYQAKAPLDMRMDQSMPVSAFELVNGLYPKELEKLFLTYGEERYAKRIASTIAKYRKDKPIKTTSELVDIIKRSVPPAYREGLKHPARRVFQALRIATNSEVEELREVLGQAFSVIQSTGRFVAISFHSLEDNLVKDFIKEQSALGRVTNLTNTAIRPSAHEVAKNPRARSAKLRAYQKV